MSKSKYAILVKTLINLAWPTSASGRIKASPFLTYLISNEQTRPTAADERLAKYWHPNSTIEEVLEEADELYENKRYIEVYELLNRLKYNNNSDVKWRIARVLYQTTVDNVLPLEIEKEMIKEAYDLLLEEATEENANSNVHKWFAITCDCQHRLLGLEKRIEGYHKVLKHLRISYELKPEDMTVCFLLGKLCFDMASLRGFKRFVARTLYGEPPYCSFEEAYKYLIRVEQLSERKYLTNMYRLGKTCYNLKQFYKAKHYLSMACHMCPTSDSERNHIWRAKQLLAKLEKYTLGREVLLDCNCTTKLEDEKKENSDQAKNEVGTEFSKREEQCFSSDDSVNRDNLNIS